MKIKVSEAKGIALDWLVALALGEANRIEFEGSSEGITALRFDQLHEWSPSMDWADGGPILECEGIFVMKVSSTQWRADCGPACHGPTPLIAAMRAYVVKKLGMEVEVPEELLK